MTSEMVVRDFIYGTSIMTLATFILTLASQEAWLPGGIGVGFYLAAVWVAARYE